MHLKFACVDGSPMGSYYGDYFFSKFSYNILYTHTHTHTHTHVTTVKTNKQKVILTPGTAPGKCYHLLLE